MNGTDENEKIKLYEKQKNLLDTFLSTGAITKAQYDKSLTVLAEKLGTDKSKQN